MRAAVVTTLVFALVAISCASAWMFAWRVRNPTGTRPAAPVHEEVLLVPGALGEATLADGRRVSIRLHPLHADQARQRFDAAALRSRFDLKAGEPFQCLVEVRAQIGAGKASESTLEAFDLRDLRIVDEQGIALVPLQADEIGASDGLHDPLSTLLAAPRTPLPAETRVSLFMWDALPGMARDSRRAVTSRSNCEHRTCPRRRSRLRSRACAARAPLSSRRRSEAVRVDALVVRARRLRDLRGRGRMRCAARGTRNGEGSHRRARIQCRALAR